MWRYSCQCGECGEWNLVRLPEFQLPLPLNSTQTVAVIIVYTMVQLAELVSWFLLLHRAVSDALSQGGSYVVLLL